MLKFNNSYFLLQIFGSWNQNETMVIRKNFHEKRHTTHMADVIMDDYTQVSQGSSGHHHGRCGFQKGNDISRNNRAHFLVCFKQE